MIPDSHANNEPSPVRSGFVAVLVALTMTLPGCGRLDPSPVAAATPATAAPPASPVAVLYNQHCAACHGQTGLGDGPAAYLLYPKPRNFQGGVFRFKSTPDNAPPTRADLTRVIERGVGRTGMPAFGQVLSAQEIDGLVTHVLTLAGLDAADETRAVPIPPPPNITPKLIAQGKLVYDATGCAACHGATGRGDGPSSFTLKDNEGYPLPPADFTQGVYKAGTQTEDLYRTIMVGVPGTPMPGFLEAIEQGLNVEGVEPGTDMVWAMVAYLKSLETPREQPGITSGAEIAVHLARPGMLDNPDHPAWEAVASVAVSLQPLWQRQQAPRSLAVRAARDAKRMAILLEWSDATFDAPAATTDAFADAGAVMFSLDDQPPP